ncbi:MULTISPECIES: hypothetical protein [Natrialbaceae]|uniref:hypothetical protein n=1 Tax=Natrialbaceae TaxID=1644061 RepID=UPI00207D0EF3|nr:hypothetical protein [Natronococcus sp. CG52]
MPTNDVYRHLTELSETLENGPAVVATPAQILQGYPVGPEPDTVLCIGCGTALHETDIVFAYAYRCADSTRWDVPRLFCRGCVPNRIRSPTLGTTEVLVGGRLGTIAFPTPRSQQLCLSELTTRAFSPPTEGSEP